MTHALAEATQQSIAAWLKEHGFEFPEPPPMAEAYGWMEVGGYLYVETVKNHPRAPERLRHHVKTTKVRFLDRETGLCLTQNTLYRLKNEVV